MKHRRLGNSGLLVSELALGTMVFGEGGTRAASPKDAHAMIDRFLDVGGNHIDTADVYANGRSEEIVGAAIKARRDEVVLATKVRFPTGAGPNDTGLSRHHIMRGVEASLGRLRTETIDLLYMHCWDPLTPIEESLRAFDDLVAAGKVRYIGVSNFMAWQLMKALGVSALGGYQRFVAAQYQYNLITRDIEPEFFDLLASEDVSLTPWSPLAGGFLSGKYRRAHRPTSEEGRLGSQPDSDEEAWVRRQDDRSWEIADELHAVADDLGVPPEQVALAWVLGRPNVASVIIGVRTMSQLESNLGALEVTLSSRDIERLGTASALPATYPRRFIDANGSR
ncbi:MAG: aldo/keto reductase [Acidimicrobiia bacterium]|nr:aldo/keto reductase [Acidimicrobiia bacterium]